MAGCREFISWVGLCSIFYAKDLRLFLTLSLQPISWEHQRQSLPEEEGQKEDAMTGPAGLGSVLATFLLS